MHLKNLSLINFKNFEKLDLEFTDQINCFVGDNGTGKTNLLDSIHYLSMTKSGFNSIDSQNVRYDQSSFGVSGLFLKAKKSVRIQCQYKTEERKKVLKKDKKAYNRLGEHIGSFPLVLIAPNDADIIRGGGEIRRKFFNSLMSQLDQNYLNSLLNYNHALKQRNKLLVQFHDRGRIDQDLIEPYTLKILELGKSIFQAREGLLDQFLPLCKEHYQDLSSGKEDIELTYRSDWDRSDFESFFQEQLKGDVAAQRTVYGIHRDDFDLELGSHSMKKFGSQGQQKSLMVAMKLTQFDLLKTHKDFKPILLMDDIFDKLDDHRIKKLMEMVASNSFGQIFVTDARPERTIKIIGDLTQERKIFRIQNQEAILLN